MYDPTSVENQGIGTGGSLPGLPRTVEETGINPLFLVELLCKVLFLQGQATLAEIASHTCLAIGVLEPLLGFMRAERLCEVSRLGEAGTTISYNLTELGQTRARDFMQKCQYAGVAPVSLAAYNQRVRQQSVLGMRVTRDIITRAFDDIVLESRILEQFGAGMNSGRAMFVYGPAGSGKTYIAERLSRLLHGTIAIPHAVLVDGEIIQTFDPLVHTAIGTGESSASLDLGASYDTRWVPCQRPVVMTGGELSLSMLDLQFDYNSRFYQAPPQVKANNGLFIIDDLGRQLVPAQELMNRWIVPLDRRVDYLALHTGTKFMVPFDVIVIFSSNLAPGKLADEAFLRRLNYKIHIGALSEEKYRLIFKQTCTSLNIPFSEQGLRYVVHELHEKHQKPLLACVPRDLLGQVKDFSEFQNVEPSLNETLLEWAWANYYAQDQDARAPPAPISDVARHRF